MSLYNNCLPLVLASASPRRHDLLASLGLTFTVEIPQIDETPLPNENPKVYAERLADEKATSISLPVDTTLISADTIVVLNNTILGKPADEADALKTLLSLSNQTHHVITAVCIRRNEQKMVFSVSTAVTFRSISEAECLAYIQTGDPMDKAGSYAIQGGAAHMVKSINGSYTNVVGLPLCELHDKIRSL